MMPPWSEAQPGARLAQAPISAGYGYSSAPAFTPVQVRQGFGQYITTPSVPTYPTQPLAPPEPAKAKVEWPESVRRYVQRSFLPQNDEPSVTRAEIETKLKATIGAAKETGTLHTTDWDAMPLPQYWSRLNASPPALTPQPSTSRSANQPISPVMTCLRLPGLLTRALLWGTVLPMLHPTSVAARTTSTPGRVSFKRRQTSARSASRTSTRRRMSLLPPLLLPPAQLWAPMKTSRKSIFALPLHLFPRMYDPRESCAKPWSF
jgi:hypothetical protein